MKKDWPVPWNLLLGGLFGKSYDRGVNIRELHPGSCRRFVSEARRMIARRLVKEYGIPLSEVA
jgi:hypothetical protein